MTKIDTSKWKEFIIGDLFEKLQLDIKNENFNKALDVSEEQNEEFNLPLVNAKHGNNGIMYYGRESDFDVAEMTIDIVQNGAIATGDVYAQPQKTGVLWDAYLVKPKSAIDSPFTLMFWQLSWRNLSRTNLVTIINVYGTKRDCYLFHFLLMLLASLTGHTWMNICQRS